MRSTNWRASSRGLGKRTTEPRTARIALVWAACALAAATLSAGIILWPTPGAAQDAAKDAAIPNLASAGYGWFPIGDDFFPPPSGPGPVVSDPSHPYQSNASGLQSTYRVADVSNPILQPWAIEQLKKSNDRVLSGKVPFNARERCWPAGVPGFEVYTLLRPIYFLQTPKEVLIVNEGDYQVRHVYMNVPHSENPKPSWYGESVGHYENGDTLVVDTIGMNDKTYVDNYLTPHTTQLHVVERFKLTEGVKDKQPPTSTAEDVERFKLAEDSKMLEVSIAVEDPGAFKTVWSAVQYYRQVFQGNWDEPICAENNASYFDFDVVPIPQAEKPDF